jgi:hypothetical protein
MHLGYLYEDYYDARSLEHKVQNVVLALTIKIRYRSSRRGNNAILRQKAEHGLDWSCPGQGAVAGPSEHVNESSDSIKCGGILDCLTNQSG